MPKHPASYIAVKSAAPVYHVFCLMASQRWSAAR